MRPPPADIGPWFMAEVRQSRVSMTSSGMHPMTVLRVRDRIFREGRFSNSRCDRDGRSASVLPPSAAKSAKDLEEADADSNQVSSFSYW